MRFYTQITALLSCNLCMLSGKDTSLSDFSCQKKSGIKNMLQKKLEDICRSVRTISIPDYPDMKISTSIGGYYGSGRVSEMIKRADIALYKAKERKDCVSIYKENSNDAD